MKSPMHDYDETYGSFRLEVPMHFNFGGDVVDRWAKESDHLALIWCDEAGVERRFTFSEISRLSNLCANLFAALGLHRGDRILIMLPRLPEWQIAMVGALKLGAIPIPCIDMLTEGDVAYRIAHSGARGAVTTAASVATLQGAKLAARVPGRTARCPRLPVSRCSQEQSLQRSSPSALQMGGESSARVSLSSQMTLRLSRSRRTSQRSSITRRGRRENPRG